MPDKYRMLTDKVYMQTNDYFTDEQIDKLIAAGHTIIANRSGIDDSTQTEDLAERCDTKGVQYAPWTSWIVETEDTANQFTTIEGRAVARVASPYSTTLWDYIDWTLTTHAEMKQRVSSVWGALIDLEVYGSRLDIYADKSVVGWNDTFVGYDYSYSQKEMEDFATYLDVTCPVAEGDDRTSWMETDDNHATYKTWIKDQLTAKFESVLDTVLSYTGEFSVGIWNAYSVSPFVLACIDAFTNKGLGPVVMFSGDYSPSANTMMADIKALYQDLETEAATWHARGADYVAGIIPYGSYRAPYSMALAARMGIKAADGYWVWFEGQDAIDRTQDYHDNMAVINKSEHWTDKIIKTY